MISPMPVMLSWRRLWMRMVVLLKTKDCVWIAIPPSAQKIFSSGCLYALVCAHDDLKWWYKPMSAPRRPCKLLFSTSVWFVIGMQVIVPQLAYHSCELIHMTIFDQHHVMLRGEKQWFVLSWCHRVKELSFSLIKGISVSVHNTAIASNKTDGFKNGMNLMHSIY